MYNTRHNNDTRAILHNLQTNFIVINMLEKRRVPKKKKKKYEERKDPKASRL